MYDIIGVFSWWSSPPCATRGYRLPTADLGFPHVYEPNGSAWLAAKIVSDEGLMMMVQSLPNCSRTLTSTMIMKRLGFQERCYGRSSSASTRSTQEFISELRNSNGSSGNAHHPALPGHDFSSFMDKRALLCEGHVSFAGLRFTGFCTRRHASV